MTTKRLGRGLADIIDAVPAQQTASFLQVRLEQIRPGRFQPRTSIKDPELDELKSSIQRSGIVEPVIVRPAAGGTYELVAGERRLRAAKALAMATIPAVVKPLSDQEALELSLIENVQREDLNPLEEARGYERLLNEFGYTQEAVASAVGKDRATIANLLRMLTLAEELKQGLLDGTISLGHAKVLLGVQDRAAQLKLYQQIKRHGWSVRQVEAAAATTAPARRRRARYRADPQVAAWEDALRRALGTKAAIVTRQKGGRIIIDYFSSEDLSRILQLLGVTA